MPAVRSLERLENDPMNPMTWGPRPAGGRSRGQSEVCGVRDMRPWRVAVGVHG